MIETRVEAYGLDEIAAGLNRRKSHVEVAMRRAASSFTALLRSHVISDVRKKTGLPRAEMNRIRIRGKIARKGLQVSLWIGSNAIDIRHLNPRFSKKGVKAAGEVYAGAFRPWIKEGKTMIFQRKGKARLPVEVPAIDINEIVLASLDKLWPRLETYFHARVERELEALDK